MNYAELMVNHDTARAYQFEDTNLDSNNPQRQICILTLLNSNKHIVEQRATIDKLTVILIISSRTSFPTGNKGNCPEKVHKYGDRS